jgi:hypothetical protein
MKIEFNYDAKGNLIGGDYLVQTQKSDNLPMYTKGKAIYHKWQHTEANCYKVSYRGATKEIKFINRHWFWINWDKHRRKYGGYTVNLAYNFIIAPKEYRLGTEEDHY